jgi:hypothetical protein
MKKPYKIDIGLQQGGVDARPAWRVMNSGYEAGGCVDAGRKVALPAVETCSILDLEDGGMAVDAASSDSEQLFARSGGAGGGKDSTRVHAPHTDPMFKGGSESERLRRLAKVAAAETESLRYRDPCSNDWEQPGTSGRITDHRPQTASGEEGAVEPQRQRRRSEPSAALHRLGEGSVFDLPRRPASSVESSTQEMQALRRRSGSALRPVAEDLPDDGPGVRQIVLTLLAILAALLLWWWL